MLNGKGVEQVIMQMDPMSQKEDRIEGGPDYVEFLTSHDYLVNLVKMDALVKLCQISMTALQWPGPF